ncbi:interleukin-7 receptor subunit alpha [Hemicordylus capensis]|uniref:interleukin-7 receptor subunit alpha n=1 Tax=Hemicordylus capensis TaxID=884348 RepID=UPI002302F910|nr:interleukin-7 receptor subunit alpha [Hemicordylus capensis]
MTSMKPQCQELNATDIIKPEAPFGLKITYQEATNEYLVKFSTPHVPISYLANKLIHEIAYRQENKTWDTTVQVDYLELKLQGKDLEPDTTYEIKVRSKPNGQRFHGIWSDWSLSAFIKTQARKPDVINYGEQDLSMMVAFILGFIVLLLIISLVPIFWKNRIKPIVWPALPNHDKTLDKLCNKLKKNSDLSCFDPESLGYAHIHTVNSIQAKSEVNCFQQPLLAWDAGVLETTGKGPDQTSLIHINHGWLKLPLAYEGMWPAEMLKRGLGRSNHANGDPFISASLCSGSSSGSQHGCSEASSTNSASSILMPSAPTIPPGLQAELYTNNETRVSSEEEAYITMASFSQKQGEPGAWQCWHMA